MKLVNLPKQMIYTDRRNLDDFLREDGLNRSLYKVFLKVKDRPYYFKFSAEKAFNEAYYISTMAMNEPHPELDVREWRYIAKNHMGWAYSADLVMSMVYAILYLQNNKDERIEYVLMMMERADYSKDYFPDFKEMAEKEADRYSSVFPIHPCPVDELRDASISWPVVTEGFDQQTIRELLTLYPSKEERLKLIDLIEEAQTAQESFDEEMELPF